MATQDVNKQYGYYKQMNVTIQTRTRHTDILKQVNILFIFHCRLTSSILLSPTLEFFFTSFICFKSIFIISYWTSSVDQWDSWIVSCSHDQDSRKYSLCGMYINILCYTITMIVLSVKWNCGKDIFVTNDNTLVLV